MRVVSDDQVEAIHLASLEILEREGLEVLDDHALDRLTAERQHVDRGTKCVRFDRGWILERVDGPMLQGLTAMAELGQPVVVTPFTLAGAMGPVTLAGALALQNAEALAMLAYAQMVRPGAPVVYGSFTSNVDMRSGSPAFGTPEYAKATVAGGQLPRRYKLPYRTSNCTAAPVVDAQAAYESQMSLWPAVMSYGNMILHSAGWLEGGLVASYEKFILDAEQLQMMAAFLDPITTEPADFALDAYSEVAPGGHFFGARHTIERYENAFYTPLLSDWRNYQVGESDGARTATERATALWKALLASYTPPTLDPGRREALEDYVARRRPICEAMAA
jgi:trimethylamine--corrinoid protein Co-methyltransferase